MDAVIADALRSQVTLALEGGVKEAVKLSIMLGHVEHAITQKSGAGCPSIDEVQACSLSMQPVPAGTQQDKHPIPYPVPRVSVLFATLNCCQRAGCL